MDLARGIRQDSVQLGPTVVEGIDTLLAILVQRIQVEIINENAFLLVHFLNDVAFEIEHHAVAVFPWRGMIDHKDKEFVFKRARPEQAAMNVGSWTPARQGIENHVGALEHENSRAFRKLAIIDRKSTRLNSSHFGISY